MLQRDVRGPAGNDADPAAELRALRLRAYGPDADIDADPSAMRRLRELEAREAGQGPPSQSQSQSQSQSPSPSPPPHAFSATDPAAETPTAAPAPADPGAASASSVPAAEAPATSPGTAEGQKAAPWTTRRRLLLAWAVSLVIAVIVASSVTWAVTRKVQAEPQQVAVLGSHPDQRIPTVFGVNPSGHRYADFYGLTVVALQGRNWMSGGGPDDFCLILMESSSVELRSNSYDGEVYGGCGAGGFPASVQLRVGEQLPDELRARFPDGVSLQFVLEGDEVVVLSDAAASTGANG